MLYNNLSYANLFRIMHEFLLSLKRWQMSPQVQNPLQSIADKEAKCIETCKANAGEKGAKGDDEPSFV